MAVGLMAQMYAIFIIKMIETWDPESAEPFVLSQTDSNGLESVLED